jgi:hypothetical protein
LAPPSCSAQRALCPVHPVHHMAQQREVATCLPVHRWSVMAAPLLISGSVLNMSNFTLDTYRNKAVIHVNQAPDMWGQSLAVAGTRIVGGDLSGCTGSASNCTNVWAKPLVGNGNRGWTASLVFRACRQRSAAPCSAPTPVSVIYPSGHCKAHVCSVG